MNDGVVAEEPSGLIDPLQRHFRSIHPRFDSQRYFTSQLPWVRFPEVLYVVVAIGSIVRGTYDRNNNGFVPRGPIIRNTMDSIPRGAYHRSQRDSRVLSVKKEVSNGAKSHSSDRKEKSVNRALVVVQWSAYLPSASNPAEANFFCKLLFEKTKVNKKRPGFAHLKKEKLVKARRDIV